MVLKIACRNRFNFLIGPAVFLVACRSALNVDAPRILPEQSQCFDEDIFKHVVALLLCNPPLGIGP